MRAKDVHPEWILTGNGPCYICTQTPPGHYESSDTAQERLADEYALRRLSARALADELVRRIAVQGGELLSGPN